MRRGKTKKRLVISSQKSLFPRNTISMLGNKFKRVELEQKKDNTVSTVFFERDYSKFVFLETNRPIKEARIDKLVGLLNQPRGQLNPVIINENWEIIEGQHRVKACERLQIPVMCVMSEGAKIDDCIVMNNSQDGWSFYDYLHSFSHSSRPNYLEYLKLTTFLDEYQLSTTVATWLLSGNVKDYGKNDFENGKFRVKSLAYAQQQGAYFNKIRTFNDKLPNKVKFGLAFVKAQKLRAKDGSIFSISTCLTQLEKYHNRYFKLTGGTKEEFLEALIECYNYRLRPKKKHISNKVLD